MYNFEEHVASCEYMGETNPEMRAVTEGPRIGLARIEYVEAHKAHVKAVEGGDPYKIDESWEVYCKAQNYWVFAPYM